ncbi:hypothetical protein WA588_001556 [Blastocystis sp. NMH]
MNYQHPERCVFIGNIPYKATREQVLTIMQSIGPVFKLDLKKDDATGLNTGIGFCEFYDKQTADEARKMNNKKSINGRAIRIDNPDGGKKGTAAVIPQSFSAALTREEAHKLLINVQNLVRSNPEQAAAILTANPSIVNCLEELLKINKLMQ